MEYKMIEDMICDLIEEYINITGVQPNYIVMGKTLFDYIYYYNRELVKVKFDKVNNKSYHTIFNYRVVVDYENPFALRTGLMIEFDIKNLVIEERGVECEENNYRYNN